MLLSQQVRAMIEAVNNGSRDNQSAVNANFKGGTPLTYYFITVLQVDRRFRDNRSTQKAFNR